MSGKRRRGSVRKQLSRRPLPVWVLVVADVLALGIALNVFALFHHVLPRHEVSTRIVSSRRSTPEPTPAPSPSAPAAAESPKASPEATAEPTPAPTEEPVEEDPEGWFGRKFADKFTDGEIVKTDRSYQSDTINVTMTKLKYNRSNVFVADVYIRDIQQFRTAFSKDTFGRGHYEWPRHVNKRAGGVVAINGDNYGARSGGVVIRNGELYRNKKITMEVCVVFWDGRMEIYDARQFDARTAMEEGAYQAWHFGPSLLDENGNPRSTFTNASLSPANPRSVIGYYEPGHYCLVVVDGRSKVSKGLTYKSLARLMSGLGCTQAYNLDGGATSMMMIGDRVISDPSSGGRASSDIILFTP